MWSRSTWGTWKQTTRCNVSVSQIGSGQRDVDWQRTFKGEGRNISATEPAVHHRLALHPRGTVVRRVLLLLLLQVLLLLLEEDLVLVRLLLLLLLRLLLKLLLLRLLLELLLLQLELLLLQLLLLQVLLLLGTKATARQVLERMVPRQRWRSSIHRRGVVRRRGETGVEDRGIVERVTFCAAC